MRKVYYLLTLFVLGFTAMGLCQGSNPVLENVVAKLKTLSTDQVIEEAYLQFDKPYYAAGDTLYFKAYVTLGERRDLSKASSILHVDLINPENVIIRSIMLPLNNGLSWGDFALPDSLHAGSYRVRAFTNYMQNAPEYFFDKIIPVTSANKSAAVTTASKADKADIQFFPEGGDLVTSLISKVAFKAIGTNGLGINAKGIIVDNKNTQVATFTSSHLGIGSFYLQPEEGKTYKAKVTFADGTQSTVDLPAPEAKGISLVVNDTLNKIVVGIRCNNAYLQDNKNKNVNLVIYSGGIISTVSTRLDSKSMGMSIPKTQFPSGIMQITLFSQEGEPLSERLVFLQGPDLLNITMNSNKPSYKTRDRVEINLTAKSKDAGTPGFFSVAVVDDSKVPYDDNNETTILSYMLLTSGLKGFIEQPNYYFANNMHQAQAELDNLVLSQGYRRFAWKQLLANTSKPFTYGPEKALFIAGTEHTSAGAPVAGKDILLMQGSHAASVKTDNNGNFVFDNLPPFYSGTSFSLQATGSTKDKNSTVISVKGQSEPPVLNNTFMGNMDWLTNIYTAKNDQSAYESGNSAANNEQQVSGDDMGTAASLTAALSQHLNGVNIISGVPYLKGVKYPMLIVVDGKIRGSYVKLDNISLSNVKNVQLLKGQSAGLYGSAGSSGVLVVTTRHGASGIDLGSNDSYKYEAQNVVRIKNAISSSSSASYRSSNIGGAGHADQVINGDEIKTSTSMTNALNGRLVGVYFVSGVPYLRNSLVVMAGGNQVPEPMYVLIDGTPIPGSNVDNINPVSVETVELLKGASTSIYGVNGGSGVLVITTRVQTEPVSTIGSSIGSLQFAPKGFYKAREFYAPKYDASTQNNNNPDLRSTIYWNPNIITDKDGNASFDFYNADGKGNYRVVVEGMDSKGNIGRQVYHYIVE